MTLKDLQEEGEKKFGDPFNNVLGNQKIIKTGTKIEDILSFLNSQTSLAYELGRKEMLEEVLKEIEENKIPFKVSENMEERDAYNQALDSLKEKLINKVN